jgi:hypothetical protein
MLSACCQVAGACLHCTFSWCSCCRAKQAGMSHFCGMLVCLQEAQVLCSGFTILLSAPFGRGSGRGG